MPSTNERDTEAYDNDYPLERLFHDAASRVLDFLILNQQIAYSAEEISRLTDTPERTLQRVLPFLAEEEGLLKRERQGIAFKYEINLESDRARALIQYAKATVRENLQNSKFFPSKSEKGQKTLNDIKS
jgi:hypothetical protein